MQSASEFLTFVVSSLVDSKELIEITEREDELGTLLTLKVAKEDMGTIIGKEGKTIQAIRTVLRVYGSKADKRVNLKIIEE
ncbi:MAG: KH domain-containing protein [Patescibacteria group bacterium]